MKAIVKATNKVVDVCESCSDEYPWYDVETDSVWKTEDLIFVTEDPIYNSDYWTRLEHQYAGMAMQGILSSDIFMKKIDGLNVDGDKVSVIIAELSINQAHALVEKLKEEESK